MKPIAELKSNRGWESLKLTFLSTFKYQGTRICKIEIEIRTLFWDAERSFHGHLENSDLVEDAVVILPQMLVDFEGIRALNQGLSKWYQLEEHILKTTQLMLNADLSIEKGQQLHFEFDHREDFVESNFEKPVFTFYYDTYSVGGQSAFLVDQSCIGAFIEGLQSIIEQCGKG